MIRAAGGAGALSDWLLRHIKSCQWPHGDYHHSETVIHRYGTGAMVLCWHCDNQLRDQTSESLEQLAHQNLSAWMIDVIGHAISGTQERELSLAELSWWAVRNQVADALPEAVLRRSLGLRAEKIRSVYSESDIIPGEQTATSILKQRTKILRYCLTSTSNRTHHRKRRWSALPLIRVTGSVSPAPEITTGRDACIHALGKNAEMHDVWQSGR